MVQTLFLPNFMFSASSIFSMRRRYADMITSCAVRPASLCDGVIRAHIVQPCGSLKRMNTSSCFCSDCHLDAGISESWSAALMSASAVTMPPAMVLPKRAESLDRSCAAFRRSSETKDNSNFQKSAEATTYSRLLVSHHHIHGVTLMAAPS